MGKVTDELREYADILDRRARQDAMFTLYDANNVPIELPNVAEALHAIADLIDARCVNMVEVVRCRDCRWAVPFGDYCLCGYRPVMAHLVKSDGYCSDGVRREVDDD